MRAVVQRVSESFVIVDGNKVGEIGRGLMVLLGVEKNDTERDVDYLVNKVTGLRVFNDPDGKMNLGLEEVQGQLLVVSQFTLLGDARKGKRPSFIHAADPGEGNRLYELFVDKARGLGIEVQTGQFQADMKLHLVNDGPVTILLDSRKTF